MPPPIPRRPRRARLRPALAEPALRPGERRLGLGVAHFARYLRAGSKLRAGVRRRPAISTPPPRPTRLPGLPDGPRLLGRVGAGGRGMPPEAPRARRGGTH